MAEDAEQGGLSKRDLAMTGIESKGDEILRAPEPEQKEESEVISTLRTLRERDSDTSPQLSIQDGITLVRAEIQDLEASGEDEEANVVFKKMPDVLLDIMAGETSDLKYDDSKDVRKYFRSRKEIWERNAHIPFHADDPLYAANRDIYGKLLSEINKGLPTPEAAFPDIPRYDFARLEPLLEPIREKDSLTITDVAPVYESFATDVAEVKKDAETEHPEWTDHKEGTQKALDFWRNIPMDERRPLLVINEPPAEVRIEPYEDTMPDQPKDGFAYILDPEEDIKFIHEVAQLDMIDKLARKSLSGIQELTTKRPAITRDQFDGMRVLMGQFEEGLKKGKMDMKYRDTLTMISELLDEKAVNALSSPISRRFKKGGRTL